MEMVKQNESMRSMPSLLVPRDADVFNNEEEISSISNS